MTIRSIITHPGSAHKDDFLACCVLVHAHGASVERRNPKPEELDDAGIAVVDVGGEHDPAKSNFDHHQFPKDHTPICALSLVLQDLGIYEDAREFCDWLEPAEWFDCRGANDTANWLGVGREVISRLNSPIDVTLLRRFASARSICPDHPLWHVMGFIGEDIVGFVNNLRRRLTFIKANAEFWTVDAPDGETFDVLYMPRTDPMPQEPSAGIGRYIDDLKRPEPVVAMVYPDRRGNGFGLCRHQDSPVLDFTKISTCEDVHFAHARGFVAKTSATDPARLRELLALSYRG